MITLSWDVKPTVKTVGYLKSVIPDFDNMDTGGGCTALYKTFNDGYEVFITSATDPYHIPDDDETHVNMELYDTDGIYNIPDFMLVGNPDSEYNTPGDQHWITDDLEPHRYNADNIPVDKVIKYIHKLSEYHD